MTTTSAATAAKLASMRKTAARAGIALAPPTVDDVHEDAEREAIQEESPAAPQRYTIELERLEMASKAIRTLARAPTPGELAALRCQVTTISEIVSPPSLAVLELTEVDDIFAPLPPVPWLVKSLDMCPGAPTLLAGYGFSGKTLAAQSLALSVAGGGSVWGSISLGGRGRVVHLDYEQGDRLTRERYQRLARAMDLTKDDLRGRLAQKIFPALKLSDANATDVLSRTLDGATLAIVDSLRASGPGVDENSSEVRGLLDVLTAVSEKTGCVCLVIHHARKPREDAAGGARMAIRGSSAIFDACASVLVFDGVKGEPIRVSHDKARTSGICGEDFALEVQDVAIDGDARAGLSVRVAGLAPPEVVKAEKDRERTADLDAKVLAWVLAHPGANVRDVRAHAKTKGTASDDALSRLKVAGQLEERRGKHGARTFWPSAEGGGSRG